MKESLLIIFIFLFGCTGLVAIFIHHDHIPQSENHTLAKACLRSILLSPDETCCVEIDIDDTVHEGPIQIDYGNGVKEYYDGSPMYARYQNPGTYIVRAYFQGKLIDMNECQVSRQSL